MSTRALGALLILAAIWGSSYFFFRIAAPVMGPLPVAWTRVAVAALCLVAYAVWRDRAALRPGSVRAFLVLGAFNAAIPYTLIAFAEIHIAASYAAVLNATTPACTALLAAWWLQHRLTREAVIGLVGGVVGVAVVVGLSPVPLDRITILAILAMLGSSLMYGAGTVWTRKAFRDRTPLQLAAGQQFGGLIVLTPFLGGVTASGAQPIVLQGEALLAVVALGSLCTAVAYLLYFYLIREVGPTGTSSVTTLIPIFGLLWSALFLGEAITAGSLVGTAIILASVWLVLGRPNPFARSAR